MTEYNTNSTFSVIFINLEKMKSNPPNSVKHNFITILVVFLWLKPSEDLAQFPLQETSTYVPESDVPVCSTSYIIKILT